jgi:hypothetical protein
MCYSYPDTYQQYNHYVCGKVFDIEKIEDINEIDDIDSILVIDKYEESYLPYVRRCRGLVSRFDGKQSFNLMNIVKQYNISFIGDIKDYKLFESFKKLHGKNITFDVLGKMVYKDKQPIVKFTPESDFKKFTFSHNINRIIKEYRLRKILSKEYNMPFGEINLAKKIREHKYIPCEQFEGIEGVNRYRLHKIVNSNCKDSFHLKINRYDFNYFTIEGYDLIIDPDKITIKDGDIISLYRDYNCDEVSVSLIQNYKISKEDELNYYKNQKKIEVDISDCRKIDKETIQCVSYNGLLNQTVDFVVDNINKKIIFNIEPQRDSYIQIFGATI